MEEQLSSYEDLKKDIVNWAQTLEWAEAKIQKLESIIRWGHEERNSLMAKEIKVNRNLARTRGEYVRYQMSSEAKVSAATYREIKCR